MVDAILQLHLFFFAMVKLIVNLAHYVDWSENQHTSLT
jgi:hypothetical protein